MITYHKICKKCNKILKINEETYDGLCFNCYKDYLYEKIDHLGEKTPEKEFSIVDFLKKFFHF